MAKIIPPTTEYNRRIDSDVTCLRVVLVGVALGLLVFLGFLTISDGKLILKKGSTKDVSRYSQDK